MFLGLTTGMVVSSVCSRVGVHRSCKLHHGFHFHQGFWKKVSLKKGIQLKSADRILRSSFKVFIFTPFWGVPFLNGSAKKDDGEIYICLRQLWPKLQSLKLALGKLVDVIRQSIGYNYHSVNMKTYQPHTKQISILVYCELFVIHFVQINRIYYNIGSMIWLFYSKKRQNQKERGRRLVKAERGVRRSIWYMHTVRRPSRYGQE